MQNNDFVTVKISKDDLLEMLLDRWKFLSKNDDTKLIEAYYQEMIDYGLYEGAELNIINLVDNDYNDLKLYEPNETDRMLEEHECKSIDELVVGYYMFSCEYGYVVTI